MASEPREKNIPASSPTNPPLRSPKRPPRLLFLLGAAVAAFLLSLPWQARQWERARQLRRETATQEALIRDISTQRAEATQAEQRLRSAPAGDLPTLMEAARVSLSRGDSARAGYLLQQAEQAAIADPAQRDNPDLAAELAGLFQQAGWLDRALSHGERAVQLAPEALEPLLRLSVIEAALGWQAACIKHANAALKISPNTAEPHLTLALLDQQHGAWGEAEKNLRTADRLRPGDPAIGRLLAANLMAQRRYDDALSTLDTLLKAAPADIDLLTSRVNALFLRAQSRPGGDPAGVQAALAEARSVLKIAPDTLEMRYLIGKVLRDSGDKAGALREWEAVWAVRPRYPMLAENLGRLLIQQGDMVRGRRLLDEGIATRNETAEYDQLVIAAGQNYGDPEKHRQLARWCQQHSRLSRAILEWEQVLRLRPGDAEATQKKAIALALRQKDSMPQAEINAP